MSLKREIEEEHWFYVRDGACDLPRIDAPKPRVRRVGELRCDSCARRVAIPGLCDPCLDRWRDELRELR